MAEKTKSVSEDVAVAEVETIENKETVEQKTDTTGMEEFSVDDFLGKKQADAEAKEEVKEDSSNVETTAESTEKPNAETEEESWFWSDLSDETENKETASVSNDEGKEVAETKVDNTEDTNESQESDFWKQAAKDLGVEASTYEEFIENTKTNFGEKVFVESNNYVGELKDALRLTDKELVAEVAKEQGYTEEEIKEYIGDLASSKQLKWKARELRSSINNAIDTELKKIHNQSASAEAKHREDQEKSQKDLKDYLSKTTEFFGGKITDKQKESLFNDISSGDFSKEVMGSIENYAQLAFLWKNRDAIMKRVRSQALETGKKSVLDSLVMPSKDAKGKIPSKPANDGEFNVNQFLGF